MAQRQLTLFRAPREGEVSNYELRKMFEASPLTAADVARRLGWSDYKGHADSSRVNRTLGLRVQKSKGRRYLRSHMGYDLAVRMAEAIGVDPWEVGL